MSHNESTDKRSKFMRRISTVGGGIRETLQMAMGGVVTDLRDYIEKGLFDDTDLDQIVAFHDKAEVLWRSMIMTNPPMKPSLVIQRLSELESACHGPLNGFRIRLSDLREKAETFERGRQHR